MSWIIYKNGNYNVLLNTQNGTKIKECKEDTFLPSRPESLDVKISNRCFHNCSFCHENSNPQGKIAEIKDIKNFAESLPKYCEIALGGGDLTANIGFTEKCLKIFKKNKIIFLWWYYLLYFFT